MEVALRGPHLSSSHVFLRELLNAGTSRDTRCLFQSSGDSAHGESKGQQSLSHQDGLQ